MSIYTENIDRIEFLITLSCTGQCKHCSEGDHKANSEHINGDAAAKVVFEIAEKYSIKSVMTFGGEPLLYPNAVCKIHSAARNAKIPKRQLITNGFFSHDIDRINSVAENLKLSGVNDILLSADAFHQETIPLDTVKLFATAVKERNIPLRTHPAWLGSEEADNIYNKKTKEILNEFKVLGIFPSDGNVIFPSGNALKYLKEYFDSSHNYINPYAEDPFNIRTISIEPTGNVLGSNIYKTDILDIISSYNQKK